VSPLKKRLQVNYRNHRKILVVDGHAGFTGGLNVGDEYCGGEKAPGGSWRDTHVQVTGPAVRDLARIFLSDWAFATGEILPELRYAARAAPSGNEVVHIAASGPDFEENAVAQVCFGAIITGREEVLIQTPYLVPDHSMVMALRIAALSGTRVKIMVPSVSDSWVTRWATVSYYDNLLDAGVEIYEYQPGMIHAKMIVIDRRLCTIGTANIDERSFRLNFEVIAILYSDDTSTRAAALFDEDLKHCRRIDPLEHARRGRLARLGESAVQLLSPLL
jgi:cardiolipin synthase